MKMLVGLKSRFEICKFFIVRKEKAKMIIQVELETRGWNWKYCKTKVTNM